MFTETAHHLKSVAPLLVRTAVLNESRIFSAHGCFRVQGRRHFNVSDRLSAKIAPPKKPRVQVEIPGLERVTYMDRMHFVPGLAKPIFPTWTRDFKDPRHHFSPPAEEMPLYKQKPCFVFNQRTNVLEGVRQALWLTKSKLTHGLPDQVTALGNNPANQIADQDERVQNAIRHARFWDTTEPRPGRDKFCPTLLRNLLHLCGSLQATHPALGKRMLAEKYSISATWRRGEDLFQVRGQNGLLLNSVTPLPVLAGKEEVAQTAEHVLETFYPISPTIDLQSTQLYQEESYTGFKADYPYPHAHTLYFLEAWDVKCRLLPDQLRAKMIMFAFGNALARAHALHGTLPLVLEQPIVVQAVGTNGRMFQFVTFQLNTTDLHGDEGVKNQVWAESDTLLYDYAKVRPLIKKKQVQVPPGLSGYRPETFNTFLSLYLHGAL